jgi:hypothetical protein
MWIPWFKKQGDSPLQIGHFSHAEDGLSRDVDIFGYMMVPENTNIRLVAKGTNHVKFVLPPVTEPTFKCSLYLPVDKPSVTVGKTLTPVKLGGTPSPTTRCFIGEAYSGRYSQKYLNKLEHMEDSLTFMKQRWVRRDENHPLTAENILITDLVGLASVVLLSDSPAELATQVMEMYHRELWGEDQNDSAQSKYPNLRSLSKAARFCVIVLAKSDCTYTIFAVFIASVIKAVKLFEAFRP